MTAKTYEDGLEEAATIADSVAATMMAKCDELKQSEDVVDVEYSVAYHRKASTALQIAKDIRAKKAD